MRWEPGIIKKNQAISIRRDTYAAREAVPRRYQPHCEKAEQLSAPHLSRLIIV